MNYLTFAFLLTGLIVFASILLMMEIGRRSGIRARKLDPDVMSGTSAVDAAVFGLMGLLIAFTFSGAASRFDARRQLIVEEANKIGTAYLRIDLLPATSQPVLRDKFRQYLDARLRTYRKLPDLAAVAKELHRVEILQREIWTQGVAGCREIGSPAVTALVLGSLNEMIDITSTRDQGAEMHPPVVIHVMLIILVLVCSLLTGNAMAASKIHDWMHILGFTIMLTVAIVVILDLEYPRIGAIRINDWDRILIALRANMK